MDAWIPCSERLPESNDDFWESDKEYLVTVKRYKGFVVTTMLYNHGWNCILMKNGKVDRRNEAHNVIAWMDMPQPAEGSIE